MESAVVVKMVMNDCINLPLSYQDSNTIPVQDHDRDRVTVNVAQGTAGLINVALRFPIKSTKAQRHKRTNAGCTLHNSTTAES